MSLIEDLVDKIMRKLGAYDVGEPTEKTKQQFAAWEALDDPEPTPTEAPQVPERVLEGFIPDEPDKDLMDLIWEESDEYKVDPALLSALLYQESGFNSKALNPGGYDEKGKFLGRDRGIAQINEFAFPNVTEEQAYDPAFAIDFAAKKLAEDTAHFNDPSRGLAAYNVGRGGANIKGPQPFGGGPRGQRYIDNVARNLTPEVREALKLITTLKDE